MRKFTKVTFKLLDLLVIFMMVFGSAAPALAAPSPTGATIASDLADYPPGATVTLTGTGWAAAEDVHIVVNDTLGQTWKHDVTVQADGSGNLTDVFTLPNTFISDYDVTASGPISGDATTAFTDASGNLWQCANGGVGNTPDQCRGSQLGAISGDKNYENGNENGQKSHWREGEFIAYRETLTLDSSGNYVFTLGYDTVDSNKHAIDYIGSFDFTETTGAAFGDHANQNNPCGEVIAGCDPANPNSSFAIPTASFPSSSFCGGASNGPIPQIPGRIKIWGANNPVISNVTYAHQYVGSSCETAVNIAFSTTAGGSVVIAWGGHIASQNDWGTGNSASFINGSPFHTRQLSLTLNGSNVSGIGNQDAQLAAGAVFFSKYTPTLRTDVQDANGTSLTGGTVAIGTTVHDTATLTNASQSPDPLPSGTVTYFLYSGTLACDNTPTSQQGVTLNANGTIPNSANFTPSSPGNYSYLATYSGDAFNNPATALCEPFTVVPQVTNGSLKLTKSLTGGPQGYTGPFTIVYDCDGTAYDGSVQVNAGSSQTVSGIPSGTSCTISEPNLPTPPAGYTFGTPTFSPSATVAIGNGTTVEVTTNNTLTRDLGSLVLAKGLSGGPSGYIGPFTINYTCTDGTSGSKSVSAGSSETVSGIATGTQCTVSETLPTPPTGYSFGTPTFSPSDTVTIPAGNGSSVTVTTNNTLTRDNGSLKIIKSLDDGGSGFSGSFSINYDCGGGFSGIVTIPAGGSSTISGIPTGSSCTVTEPTLPTPPTGYSWGTPVITGSPAAITTSGATVEVTVANSLTRDLGSLVLAKSLTGGPSGYTGPFTINYDCGTGYTGSVSVAAGSSQTVSGIPTGTSCTVSETVPTPPAGYSFGTPTFSPSATVTIPAGSGSSVTVTTNNTLTRDTGSLQIAKTLSNPDGAAVPTSFTVNYDCGTGYTGSVSVAAGGSQTVSGIPTGSTCTVSEAALTPIPGYTWGTPTVTPASVVIADTTSTFTLTVANSITRDLGSLVLAKILTGGPGGYTGPFTINYNCGAGYTSSVSVAAGSSQTVSGIPTGTSCTVSETLPTPPTGYSFGTPTFSPSATVSIPAGTGSSVTVTTNNSLTRDLGSLVLAKSLSGGPGGYTGPFTINYNCGAGYTGSASVAAGSSQPVSGIPTGTSCTVSETLPTPPTGYSFGTPTFSPSATVTIPSGNGSSVTVTTNNTLTRDTGSLQIVKTLSNPDGASVPSSFTVNYDCGTGYTGQVSVGVSNSATVNNIPTGSTCSVTEVAPAAIPGYTWGTITYTPASVVITTKGGTFSITVGNSITRDRGTLKVVKKVINDNGGTAAVSAFGLNTSAGSLTFDNGVANGTTTAYTSQTITVVTGTYTLKENDVYGYTEGTWSCTGAAGTVVPTFNNGSVQVGKNENVVCTITNNDQPGTIIIIKNAKPAQGSFAFTTTGTGYNGFTLTGSTASNGNVNSQTLNTGTYTVKESTQLSWILTGIGGSTDPNNPYNCVVTGSGGSTGVGNLNTQTATINLKNGDTVTCTFENTGLGATRTQGFWATHPQLAQIAWFGGSAYGHTFPGVANVSGIGNTTLCSRPIDTLNKLMGAFWSDVSKKSTGAKRTALDQARMQLLQQLLAAELNASAFGSTPISGSFTAWESAYCGNNTSALQTAQQQAGSFNSQGDNTNFTPGTSADSKTARAIANYTWWDSLP